MCSVGDFECLQFALSGLSKDRRENVSKNITVCFNIPLFHSNDGFWVGKSSLRSWRQLALEQLDEQDGDADQSNGKMNGSTFNKGKMHVGNSP